MLTAAGALAVAALPGIARADDGDMTIGDAAASVRLVEYASLTCPHCAAFHAQVFPQLRANYIDTRRIAFTLREFPTPPAAVSVAMFQLARCGGAGPALYFDRVAELFRQQSAILGTGTMVGVRDALVAIGAGWGLSEDQVMACITDPAGPVRVQATVDQATQRYDIHSTPSFVLNDALVHVSTYAGLAAALDGALAG